MQSVLKDCWRLFLELSEVPRHTELYLAPKSHRVALTPLYEAVFKSTFQTTKTLHSILRDLQNFLKAMTALDFGYVRLPEWVLAAYVWQQAQTSNAKGTRTVRALRWGESVTGLNFRRRLANKLSQQRT